MPHLLYGQKERLNPRQCYLINRVGKIGNLSDTGSIADRPNDCCFAFGCSPERSVGRTLADRNPRASCFLGSAPRSRAKGFGMPISPAAHEKNEISLIGAMNAACSPHSR